MTTMIADIKLTVTKRSIMPPWCDGVGLDIAARMGQEDATEGHKSSPADWISDNPAYLASYDAGYAGGRAILAKLAGEDDDDDLTDAQADQLASLAASWGLDEGEFMAETLDAMWLERLDAAQMAEIEAERSALYDYEHRGSW